MHTSICYNSLQIPAMRNQKRKTSGRKAERGRQRGGVISAQKFSVRRARIDRAWGFGLGYGIWGVRFAGF